VAADIGHFTVVYDGASTTRGVMNVRVFVASIDGIDETYRETVIQLGAFETEGLEIDTHLEHGCVIVNFLASDEFRQMAGPLIKNREALEVLKLLFEVVHAGGDLALKVMETLGSAIIGVPTFKLLRRKVILKGIESDIAREHLSQEKLQTELQRVHLQRAREESTGQSPLTERSLASISDPAFIRRALPAFATVFLPLVTGDASSVALKDGGGNREAIVTAEALAPLIHQVMAARPQRRVPSYTDIRLRPAAAAVHPEARPGLVTFDTVQLNRRKSGWSITIDGTERPARMLDRQFLDNVADGKELVAPNVTYKIAYTQTELRHSVRLDIKKVFGRVPDAPSLRPE
jgi:hypothetical protein